MPWFAIVTENLCVAQPAAGGAANQPARNKKKKKKVMRRQQQTIVNKHLYKNSNLDHAKIKKP